MIGQSQIIEKYNNLQGLNLRRSEVRALIRQAKKYNVSEVVNKLTGLLIQFPNETGFEFTRVTPIVITEDFESLGVPYLSPEQEKEIGEINANHVDGLGKRISNDDIYKMITNKFIKIIDESGRLPWDSGFNDKGEKKAFSFSNLPINYQSAKYYRGINALVLSMYRYHTDETRGKISINNRGGIEEGITEMITDDRLFWLTFKQINEVGGKIKKGSLSQQAVYYNFIHFYNDEKISEKKYNQLKKQKAEGLYKTAFLKYYNVFNERDIEGVDFEAKRKKLKLKSKEVKTEEQKILAADLVLKHMPLKPKLEVKYLDKGAGESPYYSPSLDRVVMPQKTQFDNLATWYGIAFHEHIHATGHAKRTDRRSIKGFTRGSRWGDPQYAIEELVAEIGSAFLNAESGILMDNLKNNAAYIKGWQKGVKKYLQKDNKAIFVAAGQSQKAADYILDFGKNGDPAYWNEYEKIQKEIKVKGKKQADIKKSDPIELPTKLIKNKQGDKAIKASENIIKNEMFKKLVEELVYDKKTSFGEQLERLFGKEFDYSDKSDMKIYAEAIKMFLEQEKYTKLNKKQAIVVGEFGILNIKPVPLNITKPKMLNFRDATVMMNKEVASRDDLRPVMMHVLHEEKYLIGTDAHALSIIKVKENEKGEDIVYDKVGRKYENIGRYPKYKAVIPQDNVFVKTFDLKELMQNLKGVVKAHGSIAYNGLFGLIAFDEKEIYFNPSVMFRSLTPLYKSGVDKVKLYVGEPNRAIIFKDVKDQNQLALCMPVMSGFKDKIISSIYGNSTNGGNGLKGIKGNSKADQLALFGYVKNSDIKKKTNTNKKGLGAMEQKKTKKYRSKYNQGLLNQVKDKYGVHIDSVRKALKGTRTGVLSIEIKNEYDKLNTNSDNINGLGITDAEIKDLPVKAEIIQPLAPVKNSLVSKINHVTQSNGNFKIGGDIGSFLGDIEIKPVGSVACTIDAPQGAGKTRFFFQIMNELAKNYKVLFISLEEHPQSTLFKEKVNQYIEPKNQNNIDTVGELERGKEKETLDKLIPNYDVVLVDSWNKIFEASKLDFDNDLRKAYNGKLIFAIFQRTVTGSMRGGAKSQFDGDIIMKVDKGEDFKQNIVYHDKNRYQNKDLTQLKYNIYSQGFENIISDIISLVPQSEIVNEPIAIWDDATITI